MTVLRLTGVAAAFALLIYHPALASESCGEGPCDCVDNCAPPPPTPLPPPVAIWGSGSEGQGSAIVSSEFQDGVHQVNVGGVLENYVTQSGSIGFPGPNSYGGPTVGAYSSTITLRPVASIDVGAARGFAAGSILYSVVLHTSNARVANYVNGLIGTSGSIASIHGLSDVFSNYGTDAGTLITTGAGIFDLDYDKPGAFYGGGGTDFGLFGRTGFVCDMRQFDDGQPGGTAGCGMHTFDLPVNFVSAANYAGGSSLDFIGNVELDAGAFSFENGAPVSAYLDPTITFTQGFNTNGVNLTVGGGSVAGGPGGVPEPSTWSLMLLASASVGAALRRRRMAIAA